MIADLKQKILSKTTQKPKDELVPEIIEDFHL